MRLALLRLPQIALTLALLSLAAWLAIGLMPGDPASLALMSDPRLTPEDVARLRALHGLDRPLMERYLAWAMGLLRGEFGYSRLFAQPVVAVLWPALRSTLVLVGLAVAVAAVAGVALGALAALRPRAGGFVDALALLAQAVPSFWLGILLIILFAVTLGWLPAGGLPGEGQPAWAFLVLPVATIGFGQMAAYARHSAAALGEALRQPWARSARARGASDQRVLWRHALPNAGVPLLTLLALDAGSLVSGALVTETVFARPGMGKLLYDAVMGNDYNLALLALLLVALVTMLATLAADIAQRWLDPRLEEA
ncbi:ABC transporter permease subunit [Pseudoroseomonas wenyumeiae]|uniref:ABC transporter permease n=1 Tax=Teichococcus wenyumeiae TaxID=2478470 RepID=A0A3A9J7Z2_9PROT|nr:ABC transporter permease [Pseudoroseomonas wenyumeiae]RKK02090.1 ABC transporter permease [Pseudoroseomonas wenyumeiae]RMI24843.1 ABC transporter permease subunit [Pseudoroseomonas wenyumeiae]